MKLSLIDSQRPHISLADQIFQKDDLKQLLDNCAQSIKEALDLRNKVILIEFDASLTEKARSVCKKLRSCGVQSPILAVAAADAADARISLLDSGADDCLLRPLSQEELRAHISALARRGRSYSANIITIEDLTVDLTRREVYRGNVRIELRKKEYEILECLVTHQGRAVSREAILDYAWEPDADCWNNTVDVHIKYLRDKVDRPFGTKLILTVHGVGYIIK
jgi:DNA-binding response OmpR family regulator